MVQYFTKEGLEKLKEELNELKTKEMRRVTKLIAEAAAFGDLKENAAYHDARGMKSFLLGRIEQLENAINEAIVVDKKPARAGGEEEKVGVGSNVKMLFDGKEQEFHVVAPTESDILLNKISYASPLGGSLMGKRVGDEFNYEMGAKKVKVKVLKIS